MKCYLQGHRFHYEMENLARLFFPCEKIEMKYALPPEKREEDDIAFLSIASEGQAARFTVWFSPLGEETIREEQCVPDGALLPAAEQERRLGVMFFSVLQRATGQRPAWGIITGIHPVKLLRQKSDEMGEPAAVRLFREDWLVQEEKLSLLTRVMKVQAPYVALTKEDTCSLYLSVPFCPSRCSYCSFISQSVEGAKKLIPEYARLMLREIAETAEVVRRLGLTVQSVYVGGGTPTTFSAEQLSAMLQAVRQSFDLSACREITVEAGRPDTVTPEKLQALLEQGVTRISINPQSMHDDVLRAIGRRHTAEDTRRAFALAREMGFDNINMDLIAGLPLDTPEKFRQTLEEVCAMDPESVTVHTLALKHAARMMRDEEVRERHRSSQNAAVMVQDAGEKLTREGYAPYYLYRQSRMAGNLENTGWAKPGKECLYNIITMDEIHTVLSCGAGGVTKLCDPFSTDIERIFNFKYSYEYVSRFDEILERKKGMEEIYARFRARAGR